jgi:hypothetical protein
MIALGLREDPLVWGGVGVFLGFLFGTMIWTDLLIRSNRPPRKFEVQTSAIKPPVRVQVELRREDGNYLGVDWLDLPDNIDIDKLKQVAQTIVDNNFDFSHASLAGPSKALMRSEYEPLRDRLIVIGLLKWRNQRAKNLGLDITPEGRIFFKKLATHHPSTLLSMMKWLNERMYTRTHTESESWQKS